MKSKTEAIEKVERGADPLWLGKAATAVRWVAKHKDEFTTDDVWSLVGETREPRAMGCVMIEARKNLLIKPTKKFKESSRSVCHGRPLRVWRSLICEGG